MESTSKNDTKSKVEDDEAVPENPVVPTFGRAILLLSGSLNFGVAVGLPITLSVMFLEWQETFKTSRALTAAVHSTCVGILFGGGVLAGYIMKRFGTRTALVLGSVLATIGFFLAVFAPNVETMIFTVGIVAGCGFCLLQLPCIPCSTQPFPRHQSLAIAACLIGGSIIGFVLPYLHEYLISVYSWRGTFFILSAMALNTLVLDLIMTSSVATKPSSDTNASSYETAKLMGDAADIDPSSVDFNQHALSDKEISENGVIASHHQIHENGTDLELSNGIKNGDCSTMDMKHSTHSIGYATNVGSDIQVKSNGNHDLSEEDPESEALVLMVRGDGTYQHLDTATNSIDLAAGAASTDNSLDKNTTPLISHSENIAVDDTPKYDAVDAMINLPLDTEISLNGSIATGSDALQEKRGIKTDEKSQPPCTWSIQLPEQVGTLQRLRVSPWRFMLDALSQGVILVLTIDLGALFSTVLLLMDISNTKGFPDLGVTLIQLTFITSLAAKVISGALGMLQTLPSYLLLALCGAGGGGSALLLAYSQKELGLIIAASGLGFFLGGLVTVYPKCFLDSPAIDEINYPLALGVGNTAEGITDFLFPILIGFMADKTGSYILPLSLVGVSCILCAIILAVVYFAVRGKAKDKGSQKGS